MKFIILFLLSLPAFALDKEKLFTEYENLGSEILSSDKIDSDRMVQFRQKKADLEQEEYAEGKVDQMSDKVEAHVKELEGLRYNVSRLVFLDYSSWQEDVTLKTPSGNRTLIITNQGWCGGGGYGKRNEKYILMGEACFLYGRGDIASEKSSITYHQSNVYGKGLRFAPSAGLFVSSAGAEIGLRVPIMWFDQKFGNATTAGYRIRQPSEIQSFANIYTRWPFGDWFLQSEFGKSLSKDLTIWSLGFGKKF